MPISVRCATAKEQGQARSGGQEKFDEVLSYARERETDQPIKDLRTTIRSSMTFSPSTRCFANAMFWPSFQCRTSTSSTLLHSVVKFSAVVWLTCNFRFFCVAFSKPCGRAVGSDGEASCERPARRRRERRLRSWLRHERQSVAMALGRGRDLSSRKQRASRAWEVVIGKAHRDTSTADNLTKSSMCQYHRSGGKSCRLLTFPYRSWRKS